MKPRGKGLAIALLAIVSCVSPELAAQQAGSAIKGLDGAMYDAYKPLTIERTQQALRARGLYSGPIHGILDLPTMQAIYAFQKASYHLQVCGVPTPRTRMILEQGSHTDPN
jgi:putative peptidoglycan binding protein